ncbi:S1 family peptidase [Thalassomonas haliotis]|uniref:Trypsin-like peptidase domain-containing protein n=1 Tax=Thalassomonas haliotis TaxID=485448 RepID=A0ABY7VF05_9GAMM|nr:serine protease [Thalassomonas haliotis]WDE12269.1 trypsin-like peptidase domain-containing protein [Thalassomonas haliotis]
MLKHFGCLFLAVILLSPAAQANLSQTLKKIKPAVVGIGVHTPTGRPKNNLRGTGFVVGNGRYVVTNAHVLPDELDKSLKQSMVIFSGSGKKPTTLKAKVIARSEYYDLAVLKFDAPALPAMKLAGAQFRSEGSYVAFTGFPIGAVLGLYPVTHRGIIASITPSVVPVVDAGQLSINMLKRMRDPYLVYQLDATAYPGNSGSALYDIQSGEVIGIINKVFVQQTKEAVISNPSGITYAIPVKHLRDILTEHDIDF